MSREPLAAEDGGARKDTRLESEGAEFLVLGSLLAEGIEAHKAYTRYPGWDVVALDPVSGRQCRIQVKSRWRTSARAFLIKNFECDFVTYVALNRGFQRVDGGRRAPEIYVFPVEIVRAATSQSSWSQAYLSRIAEPAQYLDNWDLVRAFLRA